MRRSVRDQWHNPYWGTLFQIGIYARELVQWMAVISCHSQYLTHDLRHMICSTASINSTYPVPAPAPSPLCKFKLRVPWYCRYPYFLYASCAIRDHTDRGFCMLVIRDLVPNYDVLTTCLINTNACTIHQTVLVKKLSLLVPKTMRSRCSASFARRT